MKKRKITMEESKPKKIGFRSSVSIYKEKFSITKNITFANYGKIANNLAKAFIRFKPSKF